MAGRGGVGAGGCLGVDGRDGLNVGWTGAAASSTGSERSTSTTWPSTTVLTGRSVRSPTSTVYHLSSSFTLTVLGISSGVPSACAEEGYEDAGDYG